jgi:hypothetical protein
MSVFDTVAIGAQTLEVFETSAMARFHVRDASRLVVDLDACVAERHPVFSRGL